MDAKALAKSKRAHSLHNKKKHQTHQGLKVPSVGSDDKKPAGKQAKERPEKSHIQQTKERTPQGSRALPSNWDRYDEDLNLASEEAQASSSLPSESVMPKSKGADYAHLISEATAQAQSHYSADVLPLFDDFVSDFMQDFGPMLAAKGQNMLSWIADDSFEFEGKAGISPEAPFLSLNLNALAEQLAKANLSERLYLQSDLFPLELLDEASNEDNHDPQTHTETKTLSSSLSNDQAVTATGDVRVQASEEESNPLKQNTDEMLQSQEINRSISRKPYSEQPPDISSGKLSTFEAASAEAELDMLLNSFSDTAIPDSSGASLTGTPSTGDVSVESMKKKSHIHDAIDILLEETSSIAILDPQISHVSKANTQPISSNNKSKIVDDFDSWLDTI